MAGLQKHIHSRENDPAKVARQAKIMQQNGWGNANDRPPSSTAPPAFKVSASRRQAVADQARIPAAAYLASRSTSPALSAAATRRRQDRDTGMGPPRNPLSTLQGNARSISDRGSADDPFDTDLDNADATTTISDLGTLENASRSWTGPHDFGAKTTGEHLQNGSEYEESLPPDHTEEQHAESNAGGSFDNDEQDMEEASVDEESPDQGSIDEESQYAETVDPRFLDANARGQYDQAAFGIVPETPNSRNQTIKSMLDSPATKQMPMRGKERNGYHFPTHPLTANPSLEPQRRVIDDNPRVSQLVLSEYPPQQPSEEMRRPFSQEPAVPLAQQPLLEKTNKRSMDHSRQPEQHHVQDNHIAEQIIPVQLAEQQWVSHQQVPVDTRISLEELSKAPPKQLGTSAQAFDADERRLTNDTHKSKSAEVQFMNPQPTLKDTSLTKVVHQGAIQKAAEKPEKPQSKELKTRKRAPSLDYTREEMSGMSYKLLNTQSFDHIPNPGPSALPNDLTKASLPEKLKYTFDLKDREDTESQRKMVFASLTIEQYEETGDLIMDHFSNILGRYKDARRDKRQAARDVENDIAQREKRVREKTSMVAEDMKRLKRGAEDVVRGSGKGSSP